MLSISCYSHAQFSQKQMPSVKVKTMNGQTIDIKELTQDGQVTVFSFWATWCKPCLQELGAVSDVYEEWEEDYNVRFIAISTDNSRNSAKVKSISRSKGWPFEVYLDPNEDTKRAFNFVNVPYVVIVDAKGEIVYQHNGYVPGDEEELESKIAALSNVQ